MVCQQYLSYFNIMYILYNQIKMAMQRESSLKDFTFMKKLGQGAFGQVHLVKRKADNKSYALKKVKLTGLKEKQKNNALNEIRLLASIDNDYIIRFKDAFFDEISTNLCIIMEYANGGDLYKMIKHHKRLCRRIPESEIWKAMGNICRGLQQLHDKKILHRDLKSANIFIHDGIYKIGDLNVSKVLNKKGLAETQTGTPFYASPQIWQDLPYDMKSDVWSMGCVLYEMAALEPPFKAQDLQGLYKKVIKGKFNPIPSNYSHQLNQIICSLLKVKAKQRPDIPSLLKNQILKTQAGTQEDEQQSHTNILFQSNLLQTIKYNPHDPRSLNHLLPRATYDKKDRKLSLKDKVRTESVDNTSLIGQRTVSSSKMRSKSRNQTQISARYRRQSYIKKQSEKLLPQIPNKKAFLPPISSPYQYGGQNRNRLSRAARNIISNIN